MANFTTENNTYCFRIGPAFLDFSYLYTLLVIVLKIVGGSS